MTSDVKLRTGHATGTYSPVKVSLCEDKERWNGAVEGLGGELYQSWEWGVARSFAGWRPWRVLVERDGQPAVTLQVLERRLPVIGATLMYAPRPVPVTPRDRPCWAAMVDWLRDLMRRRRAAVLRIDPPVLDGDAEGARMLTELGFEHRPEQQWSLWGNLPRAWMILNIEGTEQEILGRMRKTHRYLIRKHQDAKVKIEAGCNSGMVQDLYELVMKSAERQEFPVLGRHYFDALLDTIFRPDRGQIFIARYDGVPAAGVGCSRFGNTSYYLYGGFDFTYRDLNLNQPLQWRAIQWAKANGCREYNMTGAGTPYPPAEGNRGFSLYNYKLGFGAELKYYAGYFDLYKTPLSGKLFEATERRFGQRLYNLVKRIY